nr:aldehyde dehydrogenase (NADP(+)) [Rothia halotolerans]
MDMVETTVKTLNSLVNGTSLPGEAGTVRGVDPARNAETGPEFTLLAESQVEEATRAAAEAFESYRRTDPETRSAFLRTAADRLEESGEAIVESVQIETGLPEGRARGELARTVGQLRLFARVAEAGDYLGVRIEPALPERTPLPRPDLRQRKLPLGPVAVFGASNFPLAFSVGGGDTASALAAGCPVVFKAHNAHPGTAQLVGRAITQAVEENGLHPGTFSLLYGRGSAVGQALVRDPRIKAVGFTGSRSGGTSLMETAAAREVPIPVYAEMSSINPIFLLPSAVRGDRKKLAADFVASLNGSAGQLCTAPGLLLVPSGEDGDDFVRQVVEELTSTSGLTMLTSGICNARVEGEERLRGVSGVEAAAQGQAGSTENAPAPAVYSTDVETFLSTPELSDEIFGAVCLIIRYDSDERLLDFVDGLEGQLTATLHLDAEDGDDAAAAGRLLERLELTVGRILFNGWPTGVDVGDAIVHGGPYPATSDGRSTSVGTLAIERFLRPVAYQNVPEGLRPTELRDENPWDLVRRVDGEYQLPES